MRKLTKAENKFENMMKTVNMAKEALRNGYGPAHNSNKTFVVIPGNVEGNEYCALIVEKHGKPVDWYSWSPKPGFVSGFGGWYKYDYDWFIKENPWVKLAL